ncbi:MAG: hypothetical protein AAF740_14310 [Bacteroidota bacterium]
MENKALEKYVQKVLEIQKERSKKRFSQSELREVAESLGLSEADWQAVEKSLADHKLRGEGFLKYKNWTDAIEEFRHCQAVMPSDLPSLHGLARAYAGRWNESGTPQDQQKALDLAKRYLEYQPNDDVMLQLISQIRKQRNSPTKRPSGKRKITLPVAILSLFFCFIVLGNLFYLNKKEERSDKEILPKVVEPEEIEPENVEEVPPIETEKPEVTPKEDKVETAPEPEVVYETEDANTGFSSSDEHRELPVTFKNRSTTDFIFEKSTAEWKNYGESTSWMLNGTLMSPTKNTSSLYLIVRGLDKNDKEVYRESERLIEKNDDAARAGDLIRLISRDYQERIVDVRRFEVSIESIKQEVAPKSLAPSPKTPFSWEVSQPANINIEIRTRLERITTSFGDGGYYKNVLEVENTGNLTIKGLKLRFRWYVEGKSDPIEVKELYVVTSDDPPLRTGQTFVDGGTYALDEVKGKKVECRISVASVDY